MIRTDDFKFKEKEVFFLDSAFFKFQAYCNNTKKDLFPFNLSHIKIQKDPKYLNSKRHNWKI